MSAAAVKSGLKRERTTAREITSYKSRKIHRRKHRTAARRIFRWFTVLAVLVGFCYIGICASIAAISNHNAKLAQLCREQQIENESLQAALIRYSSPQYIATAAQCAGMVCATHYEYLRPPRSVASME